MAVILVADDEDSIRELVRLVLASAGHRVFTATNGLEEVGLFRSNPDLIDAVLTDLTMPVMDGFQAVRLIRQTRPHVKIACMSGYTTERCPENILFLHKPFTPDKLRAFIEELLSSG